MTPAMQHSFIFHSRLLPPSGHWHMLKVLWAKLHGWDSTASVKTRLILLDNLGHLRGNYSSQKCPEELKSGLPKWDIFLYQHYN